MTGRGEKGVAFLRLTSLPPPNLILERIFRLCVERCCLLATSSRRFDPTFPLAAPISLDAIGEGGGGGRGGVYSRDPNPFCIHPRKSSAAVSIYHRRRDASATILSDLLPVLLSRFPWHTVMKIYREALPGMGSSSE